MCKSTGRAGLPEPNSNSPYGLRGRKATVNLKFGRSL